MTYTIQEVNKKSEWSGKFGTFIDYNLKLNDGENVFYAILSQKETTPAPKEGSYIEGRIEEGKFGNKFVREKTIAPGVVAKVEDPNRQRSIERQNALGNAIQFCTSKAGFMKPDDAVAYLTGKKILEVATYFDKYNQGKVTVVMSPQQISEELGYYDVVKNSDAKEENLDELPF